MNHVTAFRPLVLSVLGLVGLLATPAVGQTVGQTGDAPAISSPTPRRSLLAPIDAWLDGTLRWDAYAASGVYLGDNRVRNTNLGFIPLWQDETHLLFADVRGTFDDSDNQEGNWGLGLRSIVADRWIVGGYSFYDHRWSGTGNQFGQVTVGAELMSYVWDFRANGYIADDAAQPVGPATPFGIGGDPRVVLNGNQLFVVSGGGTQGSQRSYYGFDAEVGALLYAWGQNNDAELRAFAGGFHFDADGGAPNVSGPQFRLEMRLFDLPWLGNGSRLTLGTDYRWDQVRDDQVAGLLRVRIPLNVFARRSSRKLGPFERRMLDRVVRDDDVVTNVHNTRTPTVSEPAAFASSGQVVSSFHSVGAGGNLPLTVQQGGANSLINVDGQVVTNGPVTMQPGQWLVGGGTVVPLVGSQTGVPANFTTPGQHGVIMNLAQGDASGRGSGSNGGCGCQQGDPAMATIRLADGAVLQGLDVISPNMTAIGAQDVAGAGVFDVSMSTAADFTPAVALMGSQVRFDRVTIGTAGTGSDGIDAFNSQFTLTGSRIIMQGDGSFGVTAFMSQAALTGTGITTYGDTSFGFVAFGSQATLTGSSITTHGEGSTGIGSIFSQITLTDSRITTHGDDAFGVQSIGESRLTVQGGGITTYGDSALGIAAAAGGSLLVRGATVVVQDDSAIYIETSDPAEVFNVTIRDSILVSGEAAVPEIDLFASDGTINANVFGNTLDAGNGEIWLDNLGTGAINVTQSDPTVVGPASLDEANGIPAGNVSPSGPVNFDQPPPPLP